MLNQRNIGFLILSLLASITAASAMEIGENLAPAAGAPGGEQNAASVASAPAANQASPVVVEEASPVIAEEAAPMVAEEAPAASAIFPAGPNDYRFLLEEKSIPAADQVTPAPAVAEEASVVADQESVEQPDAQEDFVNVKNEEDAGTTTVVKTQAAKDPIMRRVMKKAAKRHRQLRAKKVVRDAKRDRTVRKKRIRAVALVMGRARLPRKKMYKGSVKHTAKKRCASCSRKRHAKQSRVAKHVASTTKTKKAPTFRCRKGVCKKRAASTTKAKKSPTFRCRKGICKRCA